VLDGNTLLYEALSGSGLYTISWRSNDPNDSKIGFGGNKTVVYEDDHGGIGAMTAPAGDCSKFDYSKNGDVVEILAPGSRSNVLGVATFLGEIELGGQTFMVRFDTGSHELLQVKFIYVSDININGI
jgi:hypothetical protein